MNKKILKITSIYKSTGRNYWNKKSYLARLTALEQLRRIIFGYDSSAERLQRVLRVTQLKKG